MELVKAYKIENILCEDIKDDEVKMAKELGEDMIKFCAERSGVGLAAPQIGINKKLFVWHIGDDKFQIIINPWFILNEKKTTHTIEACLSYPEQRYYMTRRYKEIRGIFYTIQLDNTLRKITKNFRSDSAIIFQHETDHLFGKTIATEGSIMKEKDGKNTIKKEGQ